MAWETHPCPLCRQVSPCCTALAWHVPRVTTPLSWGPHPSQEGVPGVASWVLFCCKHQH